MTVRVLDSQGEAVPTAALLFPSAPPLARAMDGSRPRLAHYLAPGGQAVEQVPPDRYTVVGRGIWGIKDCATRTLDLGPGEQKEITLQLGDGSCQ